MPSENKSHNREKGEIEQLMEVKIISREVIKPSSPTPSHLKVLEKSLIDQITGPNIVSFISFYPMKGQSLKATEFLINHLKISLSETLSLYYPLAGKDADSRMIDCNDQGVLVVTTHVNRRMDEILNSKFEDYLNKFETYEKFGSFQLSIEFNIFLCGSIAICVRFSHSITDGTTIVAFLKCWAAISRAQKELANRPDYKSGMALFPATGYVPDSLWMERLKLEEGSNSIRRRFVFSSAAISNLKAKATSDSSGFSKPTSVEVVSAFIWKHAMAASMLVSGVKKPSMLVQSGDLRRRIMVTGLLPDYSAGNLAWLISSEYEKINNDEEVKFEELVQLLKKAKENFRDEFVLELQNKSGSKAIYKSLELLKEKCSNKSLNLYICSCWCKLGFQEVDFGRPGKPIWCGLLGEAAAQSQWKMKNFIHLIDVGSGDEIEAMLLLDQREMNILESNEEFMAFASPGPVVK